MTTESVCVVLPAHNEGPSVLGLVSEVLTVLESCQVKPCVCVVDDGSSDDTIDQLVALRQTESRLVVVQLSRNFGHQAALLAGLANVSADAVIMMDADGQHPATALPAMIKSWRDGFDVVNTIPEVSPGKGSGRRISGRLFYWIFRFLSGLPVHEGTSDFRLLSRRAHEATLGAAGKRPFLRGTTAWIGLDQSCVSYVANERSHGTTTYTFGRLLRLARDGIVGFSNRPLLIVAILGTAWSIVVGSYAAVSIVLELSTGRDAPGWASMVAILSTMQGLLFVMVGLLGAYIGSLHNEVADRPPYVIQSLLSAEDRH
jgi:glycosyltransferase involved in cell wall biosynthesis